MPMCAAADFFSERLLRHSPAVSLLRDKAPVDHQLVPVMNEASSEARNNAP
jgi:hypothetical protein